jgi:HK97 gp10 family phage protein
VIDAEVDIDISGLMELSEKGVRRALKIALNRAASPVKAAVVSAAAGIANRGYLSKSIRIKTKVYDSGAAVAIIGPSRNYVRTKGTISRGPRKGQVRRFIPANYGTLTERGTSRSAARPFLSPALGSTQAQFQSVVQEEINREIQKVASRLTK